MSVITDFSMKNPFIAAYFKGSDTYIPTSELMYIHSHPLIQPNFLNEIEALINQTAEIFAVRNLKGGPANRFAHLAESLGKLLPILSESNAAEALVILREIYKFCNKIIGK